MQNILLLGDEAIAQGAIDAGLSAVYAYPGTPSTEITEYIQKSKEAQSGEIVAQWTANEKTAVEAALGASYAGKRSMACMKHVGLNVAADAFMNSSITGVNGGIVVVVADDPSMHSSQNEQDSRFYGKFAQVPILEPVNQQQAYDMMHYAFDYSERLNVPILMRITTRMAHSRAGVKVKMQKTSQNIFHLPKVANQFVLLPALARVNYKKLLQNIPLMEKESSTSGFNKFIDGEDKSMGIIASGIAYNYLRENYENGKVPFPVLSISQYPEPIEMIRKLYSETEKIMVLEEGYPIIEEQLKGILNLGKPVHGRLDGTLPRDGELNPNIIGKVLNFDIIVSYENSASVMSRPPALCQGCPHTDSYSALNSALESVGKGHVLSDIGCYTLAALKPLEAINSCVDMGASITMAKGAADAGLHPSVAVIGDSTFTHSGMTGLLDAVICNTPITVIILDNGTTGMTGGQRSEATGKIEDICKGLGVSQEHIHVLNPINKYHEENVATIKKELDYKGVSVIIPRRECIVTLNARLKAIKSMKELQQN
ncbi:MAG: indolepyruvate ferredoxin oxidoreductase [Bacteroidetes bacterium CG2_30_33_31]|nr:MAG: indolepyruvate ferredoxin oxidoreductase [Bacteroidetes bacterium CG2_30_33_31]